MTQVKVKKVSPSEAQLGAKAAIAAHMRDDLHLSEDIIKSLRFICIDTKPRLGEIFCFTADDGIRYEYCPANKEIITREYVDKTVPRAISMAERRLLANGTV